MQLAKDAKGLFRTQANAAMAARVPPGIAAAQDLHLGRRADSGQHRLGIRLGIIKVHRARGAMHILGPGAAHQQARDLGHLLARLAAGEGRACLEQRQIHETARLIAGRGLQQARQQIGAHVRHLRGDRVGQHGGIVTAAEQRGRGLVDEAVADDLIIAEAGAGAARHLLAALLRRHHRLRDAVGQPRQRLALQLGQRGNPRDLLDQVGLTLHIRAPAGHMRHVALQAEAKAGQGLALIAFRDFHPHQRLHPVGVQLVGARVIRHVARNHHLRRLAAADIQDHLGGAVQPFDGVFRIHAALKAVARVRVDLERPARHGDLHVIPEGALQEHIHGFLGTASLLAAHDAADALHTLFVGDHHVARAKGVFLLIQRHQRLTALGAVHPQVALHLGCVEHMQRAVLVEGEEVGHIHQRRDRAQADRRQPVLQPLRAGAVFHTFDQAAGKQRAAVEGVLVDGDLDRACEVARDRLKRTGLQGAQAARRQIAGDAINAQRIGAVRGDRDLDDRVDLGRIVFRQPVHELVADIARGQLDDAVMLFRQLQLALGGHHAKAFDTADLANADGDVEAGDIHARFADHHGDALARVRRAADDLHLAFIGVHLADPQLVGIRVFLGVFHITKGEVLQRVRRIDDPFDLKAQVGQSISNLFHRSIGVEVVFQPGKREFHRSGTPWQTCVLATGNGKDCAKVQGSGRPALKDSWE